MENCFYSSDDELAWGPLTLSEIKKEFQEEPRRLISRRETDFGHSTFFTPSTTFCDDKSQPGEKINISSGTSAYFTPNESLSQPSKSALSRNDQFLKNLSDAIESDHDIENKVCTQNTKRDTLMNILEGQRGTESDLLEGIQQTLVDNTFQLEETIAEEPSEISLESSEEDDIIVITDDSSSELEEEVLYEPIATYVKTEHDVDDSDLLEVIEEDSEKSTSTDYNEDPLNVSEASHASSRSGRNPSDGDLNIHDSSVVEENIEGISNMNLNDEMLDISGVSHLSIESQQNDIDCSNIKYNFELPNVPAAPINPNDESEQCDLDVFNDTIEEMEMALRQGLNYMMPVANSTESLDIREPKPTGIPKLKKLAKTPNKFDYVQSPIGDYIRKKSPNQENFKLPLKPVKSKFLTLNAKSNLVQTKQFKNIISPVGVYIKNSPRVVLKQNFPVKTVPSLKSPVQTDVIKSNNDDHIIPEVVYKPGKQVVTSVKKDVVLPSSLQKMVQEPIIIHHECRTQTAPKLDIAKKLEDGDLTVDSSMLLTSDVSYINVKQAFIK